MKKALLLSLSILLVCSARLMAQPITVSFAADKQVICPGDSVHFTPTIVGPFTSVLWTFPGGAPSSSTAINPAVAYNTPGVYSVTLSARSATDTGTKTGVAYITVSIGQAQAISEGFQGTTFPPTGWQLSNTSTNGNWTINNSIGGFGTSTHSIQYNNYNINALGKRDRIIAPKLDLTGVTSARLTFDVAYAPYSNTTQYPDSLQVRVSTDCGATWGVIYNKSELALATAPVTGGPFTPTATQWRTDTISLTPYVNGPVLISFDNIGHFGNSIYIDNVNILPAPRAAFGYSDTAVCINTPIQFSDSSVNATKWNWSFPGGTPSSSNSPNTLVTYSTPGYYTVTLVATNAAGAGITTKTNLIHVSAVPNVSITRTGFLLNATGATGTYQWYLNGTPIPGATSATLLAGTSGVYTVTVNSSNCPGSSAPFTYILLGVNSTAASEGFGIFPNPSTGLVTIKAEGVSAKQVLVQCYNAAGQIVRTETMQLNGTTTTSSYDWSALPKGMYQLRLSTENGHSCHSSLILQ